MAFQNFVMSNAFLKTIATGEDIMRHGAWKAFLLSSATAMTGTMDGYQLRPSLQLAAPGQKRIVSMKLVEGEWMVRLETTKTEVVGRKDWEADEEILKACIAFCVRKDDWADIFL